MPEERIPELIEGAEIRGLDISPQESFVHSCIDGVLNVDDIADVTVLSRSEVMEAIEHLISLGVARWIESSRPSVIPQPQLEEDVDIDTELQRQINETFHRADRLNHYELLGVAIDAERGEIRKAYFALSKTFHPDAHYGKRLGSYKAKMEVIFRKVTDAYEAVGRPKKREAYDRYLRQSIAVNAAEQQMHRMEERAKAMSRALNNEAIAERHTMPVEPLKPTVPSPASAARSRPGTSSRPPTSSRPGSAPAPGTPEHDRMLRKRELLERRLRGRSKQPGRGEKPVRSMPAPESRRGRKAALRDLTRSLKQTAGLTGGVDRAHHHIESARLAEAEGDLAAAANALRMAITLDSSRTELQEEYKRVNSRLRVQLIDIHREQAMYEEDNKLWAAASISWAKVAEASPEDPGPPRRAARALLSAGGDLRKARDFALKSLEIGPDSIDTHVLLARIYMGAGMENSALKELEYAAKLDPGHEMVKNLRKQLGG